MNPTLVIRPERETDHAKVRALNHRVFPTEAETRLVDRLRSEARPFVALVAEDAGEFVGYILFTPVQRNGDRRAMALGPIAVDPAHQGRGIGTRLVRAGLQTCHEMGRNAVFALGHPEYYPRFGFKAASTEDLHFRSVEFDPFFFVAELRPGALRGWNGLVQYHPAFEGV